MSSHVDPTAPLFGYAPPNAADRAYQAYRSAERATHRAAYRLALDVDNGLASSPENLRQFRQADAAERYAIAVHSQACRREMDGAA